MHLRCSSPEGTRDLKKPLALQYVVEKLTNFSKSCGCALCQIRMRHPRILYHHRCSKFSLYTLSSILSRYKLIDLGYAKELGQSSLALSFVGTLQYIAPELFLSQTYSRSVDYWSLGFICHEVVTGQRPFLPNFSPGQWMDHVQNKTADEICIYQEQPSLEVKKRKDFFPENQLRRSLSKELSRWLRSLLKWDPAQRGKNNVGEVCIFNELGNVLSRPRVQVVSMDRGLHDLDSVVPDSWTGSQLAEFAERETGVPAATQLILTGDGGQVKPFDNVLERLEASDDDDHVVYVFNLVPLQQNVADRIKTVDLVMPASLSPLLQNPRAEVSYPHRKVIYSHAVAFARREQEVFQQRQDGAHALARHLQALLAAAQASEQQLAKGLDRILAKFELFQESLYHDQEKYREQARQKDHITSNRIFESWKAAERELKESLHKTRARVAAAAEQLKAAAEEAARAHKMSSTQREAAQKGQSGLQPFLSRAVAKYEGLKRIPVEGRKEKEQVMDVPQLVVKCLKQRYASFEQHFAWREQLMALHGRLQQLAAEQAALQQAMEQLITALSKLQRRRQSDVWKLVAAALQQKTDAGGGGGGGSVAGSRPGSASSLGASAGGGAAQQQGLTEMQKQQLAYLESTSERSRELVAENEALRMQMQELMIGAGMVSRSSTQ